MKKKVLSMFLVMIMCVLAFPFSQAEVYAEEPISEDVPFSTILTEDALVGYSESNTWGVYYLSGQSVINDAGGGKIGWGGVTNAKKRCTVAINAIVERLYNGSWVRVTSAFNEVENTYVAMISKTMSVTSSYSYRVRCYHYAHTDVSDSCTSALRM